MKTVLAIFPHLTVLWSFLLGVLLLLTSNDPTRYTPTLLIVLGLLAFVGYYFKSPQKSQNILKRNVASFKYQSLVFVMILVEVSLVFVKSNIPSAHEQMKTTIILLMILIAGYIIIFSAMAFALRSLGKTRV